MKRMTMTLALLLCAALVYCFVPAAAAQDRKPAEAGKADAAKQEGDAKKEKPSKFKKYEEIVTEEAKTAEGLLVTHQVGDKLYYEFPESILGKPLLWVSQYAATQTDNGYGGMPIDEMVVRWERMGDRILLRQVNMKKRAAEGTPEAMAVKAASLESVLAAFDIVTFNEAKDKRPVIEVTELYTADLAELSPKRDLNARAIDRKRTFITSVKNFPRNIETRVLATFQRAEMQPGQQPSFNPFANQDRSPSVTVEINHSLVTLPDMPMRPRLYDPRVGFFAGGFEDYSKGVDGIEPVIYISRWRLEKKDPNAAVSEPVQPIVWYIGREWPAKWRKYVKEGIEMWQQAFEKAGFKNAIIAKDAPSVEEDPNWDAEDARYSTVRWLPSTVRNAFGPHVRDPRTGEILEADVRIYHDVLELGRNWYFAQCAAADPNAQKLPFSDELMGQLLRYVICHEVGHSIGLRHNHKSSAAYTVEQLRDPEYTKKYGYQASIMDYSRFNYVAQPGDGAVLAWDKTVGIYDDFAIEWGYRQFNGTNSAEEDKKMTDEIAARQIEDPRLLFGSYEEGMVGSSDPFARSMDQTGQPVEAGTLGLANLEKIMGFLVNATTTPGGDYRMLAEVHGEVIGQWGHLINHCVAMVGGIEYNKKVVGQAPVVFQPLDAARQEAAVAFVIEKGLNVPAWLIPGDILQRIGVETSATRVLAAQTQFLNGLLNIGRIQRMVDLQGYQDKPYTVSRLVNQLADGIFAGMDAKASFTIYQRNLQRLFVNQLIAQIDPANKTVPGELRASARAALDKIARNIGKVVSRVADVDVKNHLTDLGVVILKALEED